MSSLDTLITDLEYHIECLEADQQPCFEIDREQIYELDQLEQAAESNGYDLSLMRWLGLLVLQR